VLLEFSLWILVCFWVISETRDPWRDSTAPNKTYLTTEGLRSLKEELEHLRNVRRPEITELILCTKGVDEKDEGTEYEAAKTSQGFIEGRIQDLESLIHHSIIIPGRANAKQPSCIIKLGSMVEVQRGGGRGPESYMIVASAEASPTQGKISNESPLGRALLGKSVDDEIEFSVPAGVQRLKVLTVR
jgi:transcription elongation factor GreA